MSSAVNAYHDLLTPDVAADTHEQLVRELTTRGLVFGGRPLCTVLRPRLIPMEQYRALQRRILPLMRAFARAYERAVADPAFRGKFGLADWEEALITDALRYGHPSPTSRLDFFWDPQGGSLGLTEYNAETPAGAAYSDALSDAFLDTAAMRMFARSHEIFPVATTSGVIGTLLKAWHEFSGSRSAPSVAILDWDDVPTITEFELYRHRFNALGLPCVIDSPHRCEYRGGTLYAGGRAVNLVYKRVLLSELVEQCGLQSPVIRAVREGAVCLVNGFHSKILHKKASLAVLSDEANAGLFSDSEVIAIRECIPWTRVVAEGPTTRDGRVVDMIPLLMRKRDRFVLKPNDEYGGKGITLGWTVDDATWEAALRDALRTPYIVQEKVVIPREPYPSWIDGRLEIFDRKYDTAPFVSHGDYMEGMLTRLATDDLLNVTAGGGSTVPMFIAEKRQ